MNQKRINKYLKEFIENKTEELRLNLNLLIETQINDFKQELINKAGKHTIKWW